MQLGTHTMRSTRTKKPLQSLVDPPQSRKRKINPNSLVAQAICDEQNVASPMVETLPITAQGGSGSPAPAHCEFKDDVEWPTEVDDQPTEDHFEGGSPPNNQPMEDHFEGGSPPNNQPMEDHFEGGSPPNDHLTEDQLFESGGDGPSKAGEPPVEDQLGSDEDEELPVEGQFDSGMDSDDSYRKSAGRSRQSKMHRREKGYPTTPTTSENDEEDELDTYDQRKLRHSPIVEKTRGDLQEDTDAQQTFRCGPIDKEMKKAALALKQEYEEKMEALSNERNVSLHALYRAVGDDTVKHHSVSAWNAFQRYESVKNLKPKDGKWFIDYVYAV